jgi:hypothetical protein
MEVEYGIVLLEFISSRKERLSKEYIIKQGTTWADMKKFAEDEFSIAGNISLTDSNGIDITKHDLHTSISQGIKRSVLVQSEDRIGTICSFISQIMWQRLHAMTIEKNNAYFLRGEIFILSAIYVHTDRYHDAKHSIYSRIL